MNSKYKLKGLLHKAIVTEEIEVISQLISQGADVNAQDSAGNTPLHSTVRSENLDILRLLLKVEDIKINTPDADDGNTPLHLAAQTNNVEILKL